MGSAALGRRIARYLRVSAGEAEPRSSQRRRQSRRYLLREAALASSGVTNLIGIRRWADFAAVSWWQYIEEARHTRRWLM